jgi:6-pyruvoyltetrahydropterin/6-carboxytetrahydropterin synthase
MVEYSLIAKALSMYTIAKTFEFCAAHHLKRLPSGHKCGGNHGHNYVVQVELQAKELDSIGFIRELGDLNQFKLFLDGQLDHRDLAEVLPFNPTTEALAFYLYEIAHEMFPEVAAVRVWETPKTWAEYRPTINQSTNKPQGNQE